MLVLIWSLVVVAMAYIYLRQVYSRFSKGGVRHLTPVPLLGNMGGVTIRKMHFVELFERLYKAFPEDRFVGNYEFLSPVIVIRDLNLIKQLTVRDNDYFLDHRLKIDEEVDSLFGRGLFSLRGQKWREMRSTLTPAFTSSKVRLMVPFMVETGEKMIKAIKNKIKASENDFVDIDSRDLLTRYSNDVIASCAFGLNVDSHSDENNEFYHTGKRATSMNFIQLVKFFGYSAFPNVMKRLKVNFFTKDVSIFFKQLVTKAMEDRETYHVIRHDMIQLLVEAKKGQIAHVDKTIKNDDPGFATGEEYDVGQKPINKIWSDDDLIAQAVLFFFAGFDSVSTMAVFLMYELAIHPEVQEKLAREIKINWEKNERKLNYQTIQEMTYMDMKLLDYGQRLCQTDFALRITI